MPGMQAKQGDKMRRAIRISAILILTGFGLAGWLQKKEPKPTAKAPTTRYHGYDLNRKSIHKAKGFTVLISSEGFGGTARGTGVLIDARHILTCAHMVEGPKDDLWIYPYPTGYVVKGTPIAVDRGNDLAILELNVAVEISTYAVFQEGTYPGEPITVIGNTKGAMQWFVTFGIVSGEWDGFLMTDAVLYGGNSGGPWINEQGEVVAITDWTLMNRDGSHSDVHGGVTAKTINAFLKRWQEPSILSIILGGAQ